MKQQFKKKKGTGNGGEFGNNLGCTKTVKVN